MYESQQGRATGDSSSCLWQRSAQEAASDKEGIISKEIGCGLIEVLEDARETKSNEIVIILKRVEATGSSTRIRVRTQNFTAKKYSSLLEQRSGRGRFSGAGCYQAEDSP